MRTDGQPDRRSDMTKLMAPFHNFANVPKNGVFHTIFTLRPDVL
jgi:hypothetical protein